MTRRASSAAREEPPQQEGRALQLEKSPCSPQLETQHSQRENEFFKKCKLGDIR